VDQYTDALAILSLVLGAGRDSKKDKQKDKQTKNKKTE
jgi:hypothetical protein